MIGTDGSVVIHETPGAGLAEFTGGDPALREHLNRLVRVVNQLSGHRTLTVNVPWLLARMGAAGKGGGTIVEAEDRDVVDVICSEAIPARAIAEIVDEDAYYGRLVVCKPTQNDLPLERIVYIPEEIPLGDDNVARGKGWLSFENVPLITEDDISQWMYAGSKSGSWKAKKSDFGIRVMSLVTRGLARLKINDEGYDFSDNFDVTFTGGKRTGSYPDPVQASATAIVGKGMIAKIRILAGGNYTNPRASLEDSSEDPGSGCELQVETDEDGHITAIKVIQRGSGYFEPENLTLTITGGTGCSYAIEVNPVIDFIWKSRGKDYTDAAEISVDTSAGDGQDLDVEAVIAGTCDEIKTMDPGSGLTAGSYDIVWTGGDGTVAIHAHAIVDESGEVVDTEIVDAGLDFTAPPAGTYQNAAFEVVIA